MTQPVIAIMPIDKLPAFRASLFELAPLIPISPPVLCHSVVVMKYGLKTLQLFLSLLFDLFIQL